MVRNSPLYCVLKNLDDPNPPHKPGAFLFYPLHKFEQPSFVVDTTGVFPRKLELLGIFGSQFAASVGDYLFALESRDRYFGSQSQNLRRPAPPKGHIVFVRRNSLS